VATLNLDDALSVGYLLQDIALTSGPPADLREAARRWASEVVHAESMAPEDLQEVGWLLRALSHNRRVDSGDRATATLWAARLLGQE
jgi:hypothetical protein